MRWLIGGQDLLGFAGLNGPYRLDSDHDGDLSDEAVNSAAAGIEMSGIDVGLALYLDAATGRSWLALEAQADQAIAVGLQSVDLTLGAVSVEVNLGSDGQTIGDFSNDKAVLVPIDTASTFVTLDTDGDLGSLVRAQADVALRIGDFFYTSGSVGFEKSTRDIVLANNTSLRADMLAIGADGLYGFVGAGGPYWLDQDGDGFITAGEAPGQNPDAVGLALEDLQFGLSVMRAAEGGDPALADLRWSALSAQAGSVAAVGLDDLTLAARDLSVELNLVSGTPAGQNADLYVVDFAADGTDDLAIATGPDSWISIDFDGSRGQLIRASGDVDLRIGDFVSLSGGLGFERSVMEVTLSDGSTVQTQMLSFAGNGLSGFVGDGPYRRDLNLDGRIAADEVNPDARGVAVSDVTFGLGLFDAQASDDARRWIAATGSVGSPSSARMASALNSVEAPAPIASGHERRACGVRDRLSRRWSRT